MFNKKQKEVKDDQVELIRTFNYSVGDFKFNVSLKTDTTREAKAMKAIALKVVEECDKLIHEIETATKEN